MTKKKQEETRTSIDNINDTLTGLGQKVQQNSKSIMWISGIAAVLAAGILFYFLGIRAPQKKAADENIGKADISRILGDTDNALVEYKKIADDGSYDAGNRAHLEAAILLYQQKQYEEAIKYLQGYDIKDAIIGAGAQSLEGDCYVNLKKYNEALECYEKAIKTSDDNPSITPFFMMKEANVYRELKNYAKEAEIYQKIVDEYPFYGSEMGIDVERYLERAKTSAGK